MDSLVGCRWTKCQRDMNRIENLYERPCGTQAARGLVVLLFLRLEDLAATTASPRSVRADAIETVLQLRKDVVLLFPDVVLDPRGEHGNCRSESWLVGQFRKSSVNPSRTSMYSIDASIAGSLPSTGGMSG
jgi:hypothetical protein